MIRKSDNYNNWDLAGSKVRVSSLGWSIKPREIKKGNKQGSQRGVRETCLSPILPNVRPEALSAPLCVPRNRNLNRCVSNRKLKIATLTAGSVEKSQKHRGMKSRIAALRNHKLQIAMFLPVKQQREVDGAQAFNSEIKNRCDFVGRDFKSQRFRVFRDRSVFGTLRCTKIAHRHSLGNFDRRWGVARNFPQRGLSFTHFHRRRNHGDTFATNCNRREFRSSCSDSENPLRLFCFCLEGHCHFARFFYLDNLDLQIKHKTFKTSIRWTVSRVIVTLQRYFCIADNSEFKRRYTGVSHFWGERSWSCCALSGPWLSAFVCVCLRLLTPPPCRGPLCVPPSLEAPNWVPKQTGTKPSSFQTSQKTCHLDTPSVLIPFWVLQRRHTNGYQNKRVPKYLVYRNQRTCHFDTPSVLIPLWVLHTSKNRRRNRRDSRNGGAHSRGNSLLGRDDCRNLSENFCEISANFPQNFPHSFLTQQNLFCKFPHIFWRISANFLQPWPSNPFLFFFYLHFQKLYCHGVSQEKQHVWTIFLSAPNVSPPAETRMFIFIVVSPSLKGLEGEEQKTPVPTTPQLGAGKGT